MLSENIKVFRKSKGLSQQELAVRLHVVRQTVSKWEQGLSVPDSDLLLALSAALEVPVSTLLGETAAGREPDDLKAICEKLEVINLQLAQRKAAAQKLLHRLFLLACAAVVALSAVLLVLNSPYLCWNFSDPEAAVAGTLFHAFEWLFARLAPLLLVAAGVGAFLTRGEP
ncbi:MAG TPA: helix-turn-helix transcriptional regulator [Candidatus Fournierella merdigallinarum]|nr:helix-turn-helix transcriptional regulator [Candidatus Fournierella merdigallinarum]